MAQDPFKKGEKQAEPPLPEGAIELRDICPFLTSPTFGGFTKTSAAQQMQGMPPAIPALTAGLAVCIGESCKFFDVDKDDCALLCAAKAMMRMGMPRVAIPQEKP